MKSGLEYVLVFCSSAIALLIATAVFRYGRGVNHETATLEERGNGLALHVEAPRPVATAVQAIVERYGYVITYEDPRYAFSGDLQDESWRVHNDLYEFLPGTAPKLMAPYGGTLAVSSSSSAPLEILDQLVRAQSSNDRGGRFSVEQAGNVFHVVPTAIKDKNGDWTAQHTILDTSISLPLQDRTDVQMIDAICNALSAAGHIKIWSANMLHMGLVSEDGPPRYAFGADNESARSVLVRALDIIAADRARLTWLLYYSNEVDEERYVLNLLTVPDKSPIVTKSTVVPPIDTSNNPFDATVMPKKQH